MAIDRERTHRGERESIAERRIQVLELRKKGLTLSKIGEQVGVSLTTVHKDLQAAFKELLAIEVKKANELRFLELQRMDAAELKINLILADKKTRDEVRLKCIDRLIKISESRRKLLGLDMPQRIDITSNGEAVQKRIEIVDTQNTGFRPNETHTDDDDT